MDVPAVRVALPADATGEQDERAQPDAAAGQDELPASVAERDGLVPADEEQGELPASAAQRDEPAAEDAFARPDALAPALAAVARQDEPVPVVAAAEQDAFAPERDS